MRKSYGNYDKRKGQFEFICLRNDDLQFVFNHLCFEMKDHNYAQISPGFISRTLVDKNFQRNINSLHFLIEGEAELHFQGKTMRLTAGDVFIIGCRVGCTWEYLKPSREITILFNLSLGNLDDLFSGVEKPIIISNQADTVAQMQRHMESEEYPGLFAMRNICMECVTGTLVNSGVDLAHHIRITQKYEHVFRYITEHLSVKLHIDELARSTNYSTGFFTKSFVRDNGMTVKQYIHDKVMAEVEQRLIYTDLPLTEIADQFGFCELSYFTRWFKRHKGCTPSAYRHKLKALAAR